MKRLALIAVFLCLCVIVIVSLGGVHQSRFVRYVPATPFRLPSSQFPFVPAIFPDTGYTIHRNVIPGLFYIHHEPDTEVQIYLGIAGYDSHGYVDARSFTIEMLEIVNSSGETFVLVPPSKPVTYTIDSTGRGRKRISIGHFNSEQFTTRFQGHAIMRNGAKVMFSESQLWTKKSNASLKFGIFLSE